MKRLLVLLADPLARFRAKGEIKPRYYNPDGLFDEVHFFSPAKCDVEPEPVRELVGAARLVIHPLGSGYPLAGWIPGNRVERLAADIQPDVIRAYDPGFRGALAARLARRLGVPSVVSVHADLDDQRRHERRRRHYLRLPAERYALSRADAVVCVTRYLERYARRHGARRVEVIYNRVDPVQFGRGAGAARGNGEAHVVSVGRLVPQKYQECLIRAIPRLTADLTLIGDGPLSGRLRALAEQLGVAPRVRFISAVPHADIARHYQDADIFAVATHYEGFCMPVLEAMAAGLPVVASRIGPIEELVGDAGLLVDNTPEAFGEALQRLIRDPQLRRALGERARLRARAMDGRQMEQQEAALYRSLCGWAS